jgi:hypothetical protein
MKSILTVLTIFISFSSFTQYNFVQDDKSVVTLKDSTEIYLNEILFKSETDLYFLYGDEKYYKLPLNIFQGEVDCKTIKSTKFSHYLLKFVKQSQTGITLSILGTSGSVILPLIVNNVAVFIVPPIISVTGFIVWASSYSSLKKYGIIDSAIEFKLN